MNLNQSLKSLLATTALLALVACGDKSSSSGPSSSLNPACTTANCESVDWKIFLQGRSFPQPAKVTIDGMLVLDECSNKQRYEIDRAVTPETLSLPQFASPMGATVSIKVEDMGDCQENNVTTSIDESSVPFEVTKVGEATELVINL